MAAWVLIPYVTFNSRLYQFVSKNTYSDFTNSLRRAYINKRLDGVSISMCELNMKSCAL